MEKLIIGLVFITSLFFLNKITQKNYNAIKKKNEHFNSKYMLNIYNEPLQSCGTSSMNNGSWDKMGKCSELGGGVHQICVKDIANNTPQFSVKTGQSNWSDNRNGQNHCVCLGAWSLYNANNKTNKVLKCDAIPKVSLSKTYVSKFKEGWNKWNGLELNNQIINGVESLVNNCYKPNSSKSQELRKNYCEFASQVSVLKNRKLYTKLCKN